MKILIFGASGMLGHKLYQVLGDRFDVVGTIRGKFATIAHHRLFHPDRIIEAIDVADIASVQRVLEDVRPDVVINAVGVIKQKPSSKDVETTLTINSILPHRLAVLAERFAYRLICVSTDCVFKGDRGGYRETDLPDALDLYGQSKHWGEITEGNCLTLRTSIIGHELASSHSLIDWFFSNNGRKVKGFRKAIYSGFPTITLARLVSDLIDKHPELRGLYHVSSDPIDKYSLLDLVKKRAGLNIEIEPDEEFLIDRSLNSDRFRTATGFHPQTWEAMVDEMCADPTEYGAFANPAISL
jgi:dTDP-4-dehydrorhamnose reductase